MLQIPFVFECEWPNGLCMAKLPFGCSENFTPFLLKTAELQFDQTFKNKNICIFECEWLNGYSNDLCTAVHTQTQTQTETEGYRTDL